jgi:hypothetical protein
VKPDLGGSDLIVEVSFGRKPERPRFRATEPTDIGIGELPFSLGICANFRKCLDEIIIDKLLRRMPAEYSVNF